MGFMNKLMKLIDRYEVISFDIFDTLIKRNIGRPKGIFTLVERKYNFDFHENLSGFRELRIAAEIKAREKTQYEEVDIDDIYHYIECEESRKNALEEIEIQLEKCFCQANYIMKQVYDYCQLKRKRIIITSDMYLKKETVIDILENCGYFDYEKLYLSSTLKKTKKKGSIYEYILSDLNINSRQMIHIGDAKRADNLVPMKKGIKTFYIERNSKHTEILNKEELFREDCILGPFVNNNISLYYNKSELYRLGYEVLGPIIYGFCWWIKEQAERNNIKKLFFLARDMYLFIKPFKDITEDFEVVYLEVSRKSLRSAYIQKMGIEYIQNTMARKDYTLKDIFESLDIDVEWIDNQCEQRKLDINMDTKFPNVDKEKIKALNEIIFEWFSEHPTYTLEYLIQMGVMDDSRSAIVDIGWHGTIQNMLEGICEKSFYGFYFGSTKRKDYCEMNAAGYWFDAGNELDVLQELGFAIILEVMLFPEHGTVKAYQIDGERYIPIYMKIPSLNEMFIKEFQGGAVQFTEDINRSEMFISHIPSGDAVAAYEKLSSCPTSYLANLFGELRHEDGLVYYLAKTDKHIRYFLNPKCLLKDYRYARWKEGFIKRLFPWCRNPHRIALLIKRRRIRC